jgi:N-acetylglucosamine-6-sulfatase
MSARRRSALGLAMLAVLAITFPAGRASAPSGVIQPGVAAAANASRGFESPSQPATNPPAFDSPSSGAQSPTQPRPGTAPPDAPRASSDKPNIVLFYVDDLGPHDGRLWGNASLTPALHQVFVANGVNFSDAIGETPLCCPGRGGLLTGLHTHNHGVGANDARLLDPAENVGRALERAGYRSFLIGKYLNKPNLLSPFEWLEHASGWGEFDVFRSPTTDNPSNYFYDYVIYTKQGDVAYGKHHSNRMIAERTIQRLRETPVGQPVFAMVSLYAPHAPGLPMPEHVGDKRCAGMAPWKPPNYNEADVSDKHPNLQKLPLQKSTAGWPMVKLCEQMLGVDWVVQQVTQELIAQGRFDNTLFIFTADNGMAWGQHRLGADKQWPYTTPVPLYMRWPARWGGTARTITDLVSNIDLAPTLCDAGGCALGPYPGGQAGPDGVSLLPLLDGTRDSLARNAVLESNFDKSVFYSMRTSASHPLGRWHYVEWGDGFRELYDLNTDPWEMDNVVALPANQSVRSQLAERLAQLKAEGRPGGPAVPRPDATVSLGPGSTFKGNLRYDVAPHRKQTVRRNGVVAGTSYDYLVRLRNRGQRAGKLRVYGYTTGSTAMTTRFFVDGKDVTGAVRSGAFTTATLAPNAFVTITLRIEVAAAAPTGILHRAVVRVAAVDTPITLDVVRAVAAR